MCKKNTFIATLLSFMMLLSIGAQNEVKAYALNKDEIETEINSDDKTLQINEEYVNIPDKLFLKVVNKNIDKNRADDQKVTKEDMLKLKQLSFYGSDVDITKEDKNSKAESILPLYKLDTKWMVTRKMKSIEGIQYAKNLEAIDLSECEISDITQLKDLKKLKYIEVDRNRITDVSPLANLTELEHLKLYNNLIRDIRSLKTLTKLNYLDVHFNVDNDGSNGITNADVIRNMPELDTLDLSANHITNVDAILELNKLRVLDFSGNNVNDYTKIKDKVFTMFSKQLDEYNNPEGVSCGFFGQKLNVNENVVIPATGGEFTINSPYLGLDELSEMFELNTFFLMCNPSQVGELSEGGQTIEEMIESIEYNSENKTFTVKVKPNTTTKNKNLKININATTGELGFILTGIEINQETQAKEAIDKTKLENAIKDAESRDANRYTEESYKQLTDALVYAKTILEKSDATQEEVDKNTAEVVNAIDKLVEKSITSEVAQEKQNVNDEEINILPKTGGVLGGMTVLLGGLISTIGAIILLLKK